jgi:hypothetical protein
MFINPMGPPGVKEESIRERKQQLAIQAGPYPQNPCVSHIYALSWILRSTARISFTNPDDDPFENDIVDHCSLHRLVVKIY